MNTIEQAEEWRIKKYMSRLYFLETREAPLSANEMITTISTDEYKQMLVTIRALVGELKESNRQRGVMREALGYYADESNYYYNPRPCIPVIDDDGGERAQQALKEVENERD